MQKENLPGSDFPWLIYLKSLFIFHHVDYTYIWTTLEMEDYM